MTFNHSVATHRLCVYWQQREDKVVFGNLFFGHHYLEKKSLQQGSFPGPGVTVAPLGEPGEVSCI